ncbi:hypothetical protein DMB44_03620 [Thermoplasma sp. Kam2015]|uniref:YncE family protein n=1 Tax=Thermoplasma sp. Kam2015 TaxID=2094122 RepID=UPI000DA0A296|nr:hypothetical protein [Thermoplasma sp. Kam2015]PYB68442.1 hypothetical protein DMB44_03620 [Thermoplasma sp. Kam2015]
MNVKKFSVLLIVAMTLLTFSLAGVGLTYTGHSKNTKYDIAGAYQSSVHNNRYRSLYSLISPVYRSSLIKSIINSAYMANSPYVSSSGDGNAPLLVNTINTLNNNIYSGNNIGTNFFGITGAAYDGSNGNIYVAAMEQGSVSSRSVQSDLNGTLIVVNATHDTIVSTIHLEISSPTWVLYDSVNGYLYVSSSSNDSISVVNPGLSKVISNIPLNSSDGLPLSLTYNTMNGTVYVSMDGGIASIVGTQAVSYVSRTTTAGVLSMAYDPYNDYLYAAQPAGFNNVSKTNLTKDVGVVQVFNARNFELITNYTIGGFADSVSYYDNQIFVTGPLSQNLTIIGSSIKNVSIGYGTLYNYMNSYNGYDYAVSDFNTSLMHDIFNSIYDVIHNKTFSYNATLAEIFGGDLKVIDPSTSSIVFSHEFSILPLFMAFDPMNGTAFLTDSLRGTVTGITSSFGIYSDHFTSTPFSSVIDGMNGYLYVSDPLEGLILVYNSTNERFVGSIDTHGLPTSLVYDSHNGYVYAVDIYTDSVIEIDGTSILDGTFQMLPRAGISVVNESGVLQSEFRFPAMATSALYDPVDNSIYISLALISQINGVYDELEYINMTSDTRSFIQLGLSSNGVGVAGGLTYNTTNGMVYVAYYTSISPGTRAFSEISGTTVVRNVTYPSNISPDWYIAQVPITITYDPIHDFIIIPTYEGFAVFNNTVFTGFYPIFNATNSIFRIITSAYYVQSMDMIITDDFATASNASGHTYVSGQVSFINASSMELIGNVTVGEGPVSTAVSQNGLIYVSNLIYGTISVLTNRTNDVGTLIITDEYTNSTATLNGQPIILINGNATETVTPGFYYINVSKDGYYPYSNFVYVAPMTTNHVTVYMKPISSYGYLQGFIDPSYAHISADGVSIPVSNGYFNQSLTPGFYYISAFAPGYSTALIEVNISQGKTTTVNLALQKISRYGMINGNMMPFNASDSPSVLINGTVAALNLTGYFSATVPYGTYTVSAYENGYYPLSITINVSSTETNVSLKLAKEPAPTSTAANSGIDAYGYNATVTTPKNVNDSIVLNYTATSGSIVIQVPLQYLKNATISDILNSKVYINGTQYKNFSIVINSNYSVYLVVYGVNGDPQLRWVYVPSTVSTPPPSPTPTPITTKLPKISYLDIYLIAGILAIVVVVAAVAAIFYRRRR